MPSSVPLLSGRQWAKLDGLVQIGVGEYFWREGSIPWEQLTALLVDR